MPASWDNTSYDSRENDHQTRRRCTRLSVWWPYSRSTRLGLIAWIASPSTQGLSAGWHPSEQGCEHRCAPTIFDRTDPLNSSCGIFEHEGNNCPVSPVQGRDGPQSWADFGRGYAELVRPLRGPGYGVDRELAEGCAYLRDGCRGCNGRANGGDEVQIRQVDVERRSWRN